MGPSRRISGSSDSDSASDRSRSRGRSSSSDSRSSASSRSRASSKSASRSRSPLSSGSSSASSASSGKRSDRSDQSSGSKKGKRLTKAKERKASAALLSKLSDSGSDSESEDETKKVNKKKSPSPEPKKNHENVTVVENNDKFDDGLDDDLIGDEEDRNMLEEMTEKEREEELFRRAERREELKKRFEITQKLKLQNKDKLEEKVEEEKSEGEVSSDDEKIEDRKAFSREQEGRVKGYEVKHASKFNALNALKAQREQKEKKELERKEKESKRKKESESSDNSDMEKLAKHRKKKSKVTDIYSSSSDSEGGKRRRSSSSSSSSSDSGSLSSGESDTERHSSNKRVQKISNIETVGELDKIRLSRYKLDRFCHLPIFQKTVVGCFVRISIGNHPVKGPMYRVAEILDVCETAKVYEVIKNRTNIGLKVRHGKDTKVFRMNFISNSSFTESEFNKWQEACKEANLDLPTRTHVVDRQKSIQYALEYKFSNADVDKMLKSKEKFAKGPKNLAVYKAKLQRDKITAQNNGNAKEVEDLEQKLSELEERAEDLDKKRCGTLSNITFINDRNRKLNIQRAEAGIKLEEERIKKEGHVQDPFTRRKTRPTLSLPKTAHKSPEKMTSELLLALEKEREEKAKAELKEKENIIVKENVEDTTEKEGAKKEVSDIFNAHDFDIDIDITGSVQSTASLPSSLSVRPVVSYSAPQGPVKKSLKLEDYKKRRGII